MALLDEILTHLASEGVGTIGVDLFKLNAPPTVETCIVVRDYGGSGPVFTHDSTSPEFELPRFQVMARASTGTSAETLARSAYTALLPLLGGGTLSGTHYLSITPLDTPFYLGADENQRQIFVVNFEARRTN